MAAKKSAGHGTCEVEETMNVGLYSGAAGMRVGQDYQELVSQNLALQSIPGFKQTLPVFSTDPAAATNGKQSTSSGNPAAVTMTRVIDFSQGQVQPTGNPYNLAIQGQAFFQVREANGKTSYTRNGSFQLSPQGQIKTADGAEVLGAGGASVHIDTKLAGPVTIGSDGAISLGGVKAGSIGFAHFDNPSAALQAGPFGRFTAIKDGDAKQGLGKNDMMIQGSLEQSNGNPVSQMAEMIQAMRLYEANQKSVQAIDDSQNQLITTLGSRA